MNRLASLNKLHRILFQTNCKFSSNGFRSVFQLSNEVSECLERGGPVVALESTIITHGMPYPDNLKTALKVEDIVRKNNAVPATVAILRGKVCIGLDQEKLEILASNKDKPMKLSRRDLPNALSKGLSGGTTVASTMALAHRAGIKVFVTGGIGGVHRGGEASMDISADLLELSRTPMTVISAGVKSILDIGRTLEFLETHGVCVATFGDTKEFPSFFTRKSGFFSPCSVATPKEAAAMIASRDQLSLESGILIAVPIPSSEAAQGEEIESAIKQALDEVRLQNVCGKDITPFVLGRVQQLTKGASLKANISLVENNADVGSQVAVELSKIGKRSSSDIEPEKSSHFNLKKLENRESDASTTSSRPVVIGGAGLDFNVSYRDAEVTMNGSTLEGKIESSGGGVGRNLADGLHKLGGNPFFISTIGSDDNGKTLLAKMAPMDVSGVRVLQNFRTATFVVLLNGRGECLSVIGDNAVYEEISREQLEDHKDVLLKAPLVVTDGNIPVKTMRYLFEICSQNKIPVWYEPTDMNKAAKLLECEAWKDLVLYASPNLEELRVMHAALQAEIPRNLPSNQPTLEECLSRSVALMEVNHSATFIVTLGSLGVLVVTRHTDDRLFVTPFSGRDHSVESQPLRATHYPPPNPEEIVSVSGAGDCFASAMIAAMVRGCNQDRSVRAGQQAALLSLQSCQTVPASITTERVFGSSYDRFPDPVSMRV